MVASRILRDLVVKKYPDPPSHREPQEKGGSHRGPNFRFLRATFVRLEASGAGDHHRELTKTRKIGLNKQAETRRGRTMTARNCGSRGVPGGRRGRRI
jgi:hypothetical protein